MSEENEQKKPETLPDENALIKKLDDLLGVEYVQQYLFDERVFPRKCTAADKYLRKKTIRRLVVIGVGFKDVAEYCRYRFGIGEKQVHKYLTEIYDEFKKVAAKDIESKYALHIERLEMALVDSIRAGDMDNRVKLLKEIGGVQGLHKFAIDLTSAGERLTIILGDQYIGNPNGQPSQSPS